MHGFFNSESIFLTESERSGERLQVAARRVSESKSITGLKGREQDGLWILDDEFWIVGGLVLKDCKYAL